MERDRKRTEQVLVDAVGDIVLEGGFSSLGVNAVAARAGVSKMLIYRYFDGMDGLLEVWALQHSYWAEQSAAFFCGGLEGHSGREQVKLLFRRQLQSLREDPLKREVLRWLLTEDHPVARKVMRRIEQQGHEVNEHFTKQIKPQGDAESSVALLIAGIYYLSLVSDRTNIFNGVALDSDEGWRRLEGAVERHLDALLGSE